MKKEVTKKAWLLLVLFLLMTCLTSCGDISTPSFQEQLEEQRSFEKGETTPAPSTESASERAEKSNNKLNADSKSDYDTIMKKYSHPTTSSHSLGGTGLYYYYKFYDGLCNWAGPIAIGSIIIGGILFFIAKGNKRVRSFGLFSLVLGLPAILVVLVYGLGYFNSVFL